MRSLLLLVTSLAALVVVSFDSAAHAAVTQPSALVPFFVKAADYDRHFASKAGSRVQVLVTYNAWNNASESTARDLAKNLGNIAKIAGLSHDDHVEPYAGAEALAIEVRATQTAIVIVSSGLGGEAASIAHELDGIDVLSVAVDPDDVARGIVLGLDARDAKPKILVRLGQARRQDVAFEASFLALARIE